MNRRQLSQRRVGGVVLFVWVREFFAGVRVDEAGEQFFGVALVLDDKFQREWAGCGDAFEGGRRHF